MRPFPVPHFVRFPFVLAAAALLAVAVPRAVSAPAAPAKTGELEVRLILLGAPVPGVAIQARDTGLPGLDVWMDDSTAAVDTTDAKGIAHFRGLAPGRYHVLANCSRLSGDRIAGTISTKADVAAGQVAHSTLTLRPGGRIRGLILEGDRPLSKATVETQVIDAMPSSCPILDARNPGPDGRFEVSRVPVDARFWVKVYRPLGSGDLQLWKDFHLTEADTVDATWRLPAIDTTQFATVRLGVRLTTGGPAEGGHMELSTIHPDGWRYFAGFDFTAEDSLHVLTGIPPGRYNVRGTAKPGIKTWWNAPAESLDVEPGAKVTRLLTGRPVR